MTNSNTGMGSNWNSKTAQYLAFYSSNNYWADHKVGLMHDQVEIYYRGVSSAVPSPTAFANDPVLASRYFSDAWQNYMESYPTAYIIPFDALSAATSRPTTRHVAAPQRHPGDQSVLRLHLERRHLQAGSYVVWMAQALRGLAWNALSVGADISGTKITTLYATPAVWSHAAGWGADVVEVPQGDSSFVPTTNLVSDVNTLDGGMRDGVDAPSDWYAVALKGVHEYPAIRSLLNSGIEARWRRRRLRAPPAASCRPAR